MPHSKWEAIKGPQTGLERYVINMIENNIHNIYKKLQLDDPGDTSYIKEKWELM